MKGEQSVKSIQRQIDFLQKKIQVIKYHFIEEKYKDFFFQKNGTELQHGNLRSRISFLRSQIPVYHRRDKDITTAMQHMPVAHCISQDRAQSKGIADSICKICPANRQVYFVPVGSVSVTRSNKYVVYNLVTKCKYYEKPSYDSLKSCLKLMREKIIEDRIEKLAIPELGCGLDQLKWSRVLPMIKETLHGLKLDVYVYKI
jgi:Macro domain